MGGVHVALCGGWSIEILSLASRADCSRLGLGQDNSDSNILRNPPDLESTMTPHAGSSLEDLDRRLREARGRMGMEESQRHIPATFHSMSAH